MAGRCRSCGVEMVAETDHAGDDQSCEFCSFCADREGNLKKRSAVEAALKRRIEEEHPEAKEEQVREHIRRQLDEMPAWK